MSGGCNDEFYKNEGTLNKSKILQDMHPDITKVAKRFNRWHHYVNYSGFKKNKLIKKDTIKIKNIINDYGMTVKEVN